VEIDMTDESELKGLLTSQRLAVLATQSEGRPHGCLVNFACSDDLRYLFFATRRDTRKYHDIITGPRVAMLMDNRTSNGSDLSQAIAVTARGMAHELTGDDQDLWLPLYLSRHPDLEGFVRDSEVALIRVEVEDYLVARFDTTRTVRPD